MGARRPRQRPRERGGEEEQAEDYRRHEIVAHHVPFVLLGPDLLWFGQSEFIGAGHRALTAIPSYGLVLWRTRTRLDDSLDVLGHGQGASFPELFSPMPAPVGAHGDGHALAPAEA